MTNGLENLVAEGLIAEVISRLKSGKEADVYIVRYGGRVVAAKVYKDREHRSFKNNADYKEGRAVRNTRSQRAMDRGSKFGKGAAEDAWKSAEVDALYKLHAAGVRVPTPVLFLEGVLLMELVLDRDGAPATRVIDMQLDATQARAAYHDLLTQLVRILSCDLIHGDLSPYNVLWSGQGPTIIDFPQIISASHNSRSEAFFRRDARNILGHFASIDPSLHSRSGDVDEIWRAYLRRELTPDFLPTGRARRAEPRAMPRGRDGAPHDGSRPTHALHEASPRGAPEGPRRAHPAPAHAAPARGPSRSPAPRDARRHEGGSAPAGDRQPPTGQPQHSGQRRPEPQHSGQRRPEPQHSGQRRPEPQHSGQRRPEPQHSGQRRPGPSRGPEVIVLARRPAPGGAPPPRVEEHPVERSHGASNGSQDSADPQRRRRPRRRSH